jgi:small subunit ribosomal protein S4e
MGESKHLKRMNAPTLWPISRKVSKWSVKSKPGAHPIDQSFPLLLIIRDILGLAKTRREVNLILSEGNIKVDGKIRGEDDYPVGLMDVLEISVINKAYRLLPLQEKGLVLHNINGDEKGFKLCKIVNKTSVKKGNTQLNLHDGRNIFVKVADSSHPEEDVYAVSDLLKIKVPSSEILEHLKFDEGVLAIVTDGKNRGLCGRVVKIGQDTSSNSRTITLQDNEEHQFKTIIDYVFPIGKSEPWISLPSSEGS